MKALLFAAALSVTTLPAFAQDSSGANDAALVQRLVLNSAVLQQSFRDQAAEEQRAFFERLSARENELAEALRNAELERAQRQRLEGELAQNIQDKERLVDQLAEQNESFANERRAIVQQFTGVVAEASPAKREALERFASGDRAGAYSEIVDITRAENEAYGRAADAARAQNLRNLLLLTQELMAAGDTTIDSIIPIAREILQYDPHDVSVLRDLILSLQAQYRDAEAVAVADAAIPALSDTWDQLGVESRALAPRLTLLPEAQATARMNELMRRIVQERPDLFNEWQPEDLIRFCDAVTTIVSDTSALRNGTIQEGLARRCLVAYDESPRLHMSIFTLLASLGNEMATQRKYAEARVYADALKRVLDGTTGLERFPFVLNWLRSRHARLQQSIEVGEGRLVAARQLNLDEGRVPREALTMFGERSADARDQFNYAEAVIAENQGKHEEARRLLREVIARDMGPVPTVMSREAQNWIYRQASLTMYATLSMRAGDLEAARTALAQARDISIGLQLLHPLGEPALVRSTHDSVYSNMTFSVLARAQLRDLDGQYEDASRILANALTSLQPHVNSPTYQPVFAPFRVSALIQLGEMAARAGDLDTARTRLEEARTAAAEYATAEPQAFEWIEANFRTRLRLAQISGDTAAIQTLRTERDALQADGRSFGDDEPWVQDLRDWRPGRRMRWYYYEPRRR